MYKPVQFIHNLVCITTMQSNTVQSLIQCIQEVNIHHHEFIHTSSQTVQFKVQGGKSKKNKLYTKTDASYNLHGEKSKDLPHKRRIIWYNTIAAARQDYKACKGQSKA
ncbi:hypothetical protein RYX36_007263 [Vicia faba]